jgi:hypothetical protein
LRGGGAKVVLPPEASPRPGQVLAVVNPAGEVTGAALTAGRTDDGSWTADVVAGKAEAGSRVVAPARPAPPSGRFVAAAPPPPAFRYQSRFVWVAPGTCGGR